MALCDTHFHYDLFEGPDILDQIERARVYTIAVTNAPSTFFYTKKAEHGQKYLRAALGFHPELAKERAYELPLFRELISQTRFIGEIGLDRRKSPDFTEQRKVFTQIIDWCADSTGKIITIHSRGAEKEVVETIGDNYPGKIILHWYSGPVSVLEKALAYGYFFSVNLSMARSDSGKRILAAIPKERLLTESDGPFQKFNGQPASPLIIPHTIHALSEITNKDNDIIKFEDQISINFRELLSDS